MKLRPPRRRPAGPLMTIDVVIPTLDEAAAVAAAVASAVGPGIETFVADGGSRDDTRQIAERAGARVLLVQGGRATQQNAGARAGDGELLLFLHADTLLPEGWTKRVRDALADPCVALGAFRLSIADATRAERLIAAAANLRSRSFGVPYGDQALFLRRETFDALGGFASLPFMEDRELALRARKLGRIALVDIAVETSPRRWRRLGPARTTLLNAAMIAGYRLGVAPERLARVYRSGLLSGFRAVPVEVVTFPDPAAN